jgi:hypothetical protein
MSAMGEEATRGQEERRALAADFFNRVWELLEQPRRTREQDDEMLHGAHASRALWAGVGTLADFDLPFAFEALARANAVAGERDAALSWLERAAEAALRIAEADDRELVATDLRDVRRLL